MSRGKLRACVWLVLRQPGDSGESRISPCGWPRLSFSPVCMIVVIESCLRMSAVCLDSSSCPTSARNSDCSPMNGARRLRRRLPTLGVACRVSCVVRSNFGFRTDFGFEVILRTPNGLDCSKFKLFSTVARWLYP